MQPTRLLGPTRYELLDRVERDPSKPADAHGTSAYVERRGRRLGPRCDPSAIADEQAQQRLSAGQLRQEIGLLVTTEVGTLSDTPQPG
jgi:hypothetical protein